MIIFNLLTVYHKYFFTKELIIVGLQIDQSLNTNLERNYSYWYLKITATGTLKLQLLVP
jgi:hypothetical protein